MLSLKKLIETYHKKPILFGFLFFIGGFLFDLLTLGRIDDLFNLIQQGCYLFLLGFLLMTEGQIEANVLKLNSKGQKLWQFHDLIVHFLFGSLLSAYTIFYFTSASHLTSFLYLGLLIIFMIANEFPQIQKIGHPIRVILLSLCSLSYFAFFYPILFGKLNIFTSLLGVISSGALFYFIGKWQQKKNVDSHFLLEKFYIPAGSVHILYLLFYFMYLIPPVPLAVKKIGVYYDVKKINSDYHGYYLSHDWKFWQDGSQDFIFRDGDKVHILLSIFSPTDFQDTIFLKWSHENEKDDFISHDRIPLEIRGGRDQGYRGFGSKQNISPGNWRVDVETSDGRILRSIEFNLQKETTITPRNYKIDLF